MRYVLWAVFAMVSYSFVMVVSVLVTAATGDWQNHIRDRHARPLRLCGRAHAHRSRRRLLPGALDGEASVVVPIYGMFIAGGAILGILVLDEPAPPGKLLGLGLATVAVLLVSS